MSVQYVMPIPIYSVECIDNVNEIQQEIDSVARGVGFKHSEGWGQTHYLSDPTFKENFIEDNKLDTLKKELDKHVEKYCDELEFKKDLFSYRIESSWLSLFQKNSYGHIHDHGSSDISGVYYHKTNGDDGSIFFVSPAPSSSRPVQICNTRLTYPPITGGLILFPGWLRHGIETNTTDNTRISLSFNYQFDRNK